MLTVGDWIRLNGKRYPNREAIVADDARRTFGEIAERSRQFAAGTKNLGLVRGDRVGVLAGNSAFNAELFFGISSAGLVYVAFNWRWAAEELARAIIETHPSIIIFDDDHSELLSQAIAIIESIFGSEFDELPMLLGQQDADALRGEAQYEERAVTLEDPICLLFTGGSTGVSKAVVLSHRSVNVAFLNEYIDCNIGAEPEERGLVVTPLFHVAGLVVWMFTHFASGKACVIASKFEESQFLELVERERITNTFMIPNMMRQLMQAGVFEEQAVQRNLRALHTGAGLVGLHDKEQFVETLPNAGLYIRYGLTEAGPMCTRLRPEDILKPELDGSIGQEYRFAEVVLKGIEGNPDPTEPGELGEICMRGPGMMSGYFNRPEATAVTVRDGWLHTGDLAIRNEEGYYFFQDRLKEMIKSGGENVYSSEVEQFLHLHPAVVEAAVLGVASERWGEEVRAVVSLRSGMDASGPELSAFLRDHLAGYKVPKEYLFLAPEELPRSGAGKLVKQQLKEQIGWA